MIDFVVVSSDLWTRVSETRVRRGAGQSTDNHLDRLADPKGGKEKGF